MIARTLAARPLRRPSRLRSHGQRLALGAGIVLAASVLASCALAPESPSATQAVAAPPPVKPQAPPLQDAPAPPPKPAPEHQPPQDTAKTPAAPAAAVTAAPAAAVTATGRKATPATTTPTAATTVPRADTGIRTVALPPVPAAPPSDAGALARLLSRPPIAPPVPAAVLIPADSQGLGPRCTEATRAAREAVLSALSVPRDNLTDTAWVEPILKVTELALVACRGDTAGPEPVAESPPPAALQAATYWRATAFLLHGQYARAAVHYGRTAEMDGAYAWQGYSNTLATVLDTCARDHRPAIETWRLAGLLEARGEADPARRLYKEAANSDCAPLAKLAAVRVASGPE